jgi:hypothetical protein
MCGTEYGGDKRRFLFSNALTGPLPAELGELVKLQKLCVRPAPPHHLAMWGQLPSRGCLARWVRGAEC